MKNLSTQTKYYRFNAIKNELTPAELVYLTETDGDNHFALIALAWGRGGKRLGAGIARFVRDKNNPEIAEFSIVVVDVYQKMGLGLKMCKRIMAAARERKIRILRGFVNEENLAMIRILDKCGYTETIPADKGILQIDSYL